MIRLFHVYFPTRTLLLAASEALLVMAALTATTLVWLRQDIELNLRYEHGLIKILVASLVCMLCMYYYDLYDSSVLKSKREALTRLVQVLGAACVALAVLFYVFPAAQIGGAPLLSSILLAGVCLALCRTLYLFLVSVGGLNRRALLLGNGVLADPLCREISSRPELGLKIYGCVQTGARSDQPAGVLCLGTMDELPTLIERHRIDEIIIAMEGEAGRPLIRELLPLEARGVRVEDGVRTYEAITGRVPLAALPPGWSLPAYGFRISRFTLIYKRACSLVVSTVGLILSAPIMALTALAVRLDSPGPILFRQARVGKDGRIFQLYKFRSMVHDPSRQDRPALKGDDRITRVGRWIRRMRIDELPQLYNILIGDMYLIGPRPFAHKMEDELAAAIPFYKQRWNVKPGATGWAQVQRGYCVSLEDNIEKLSYDLFYIKNISVGFDFLILFQTIKVLLLGRGAQ